MSDRETDGAGAASGQHPPHGSLGEEAVKLAEAVQAWLGERSGRGAEVWAAATAPEAFESPECRICPVCRVLHYVTSMQPEVFAHLADAAGSLAAAVRAVSEQDGQPDAAPPPEAANPWPADPAAPPAGEAPPPYASSPEDRQSGEE